MAKSNRAGGGAAAVSDSGDENKGADNKTCRHCDEDFSLGEYETHEASCDWKPSRCGVCNMVIIMRDLGMHEKKCKQKNLRACR
jgi:hypothetical protein